MKQIFKQPSIWLLIFLVGFPQISETIYTPSLPELASQLNTTGNQIQRTLSIYFIGFSLGVFLWGILCDKIGRRLSMLMGIFFYILGSIACLLSKDISMLLFSRFIQALGAAAGSIVTQTIMRDVYDDRQRPQVFAKISAVLAFSPAIGPLLGSIIGEYGGINYVFLFLILTGVTAIVLGYRGLSETKPSLQQTNSILKVAKRMLLDANIWIYACLIGIINGIIFSYYAEMPFIFINYLGFTSVQYGFIGVVVALATFLGATTCKKLSVKMHFTKMMLVGYMIMMAGSLIFLSTTYLHINLVYSSIGFLVGIFFIMFGIGVSLPPCLSNALLDYKDCLGISGAFLGLLYYLIVGSITEGMSILHDGNITTLPIYFLVLTLVLIGLTYTLMIKRRNH